MNDSPVTLQPRRAGEILRAAFELYQRHALALVALTVVMVTPLGILNWQHDCSRTKGCRITVLDGLVVSTSWSTTAVTVVVLILLLASFGALLAVVVWSITAGLGGEDAGLRRSLRAGLARPGALLQAAILVVGSMAALVVAFLPGMYLSGRDGPLPQMGVVANLALVMVASLYLGPRLAVSIPAAVVEGRRWPQALARSWSLVDGHWGHVLATLFLALVVWGLVGSLVSLPLEVVTGSVGDGWLGRMLQQAAVTALVMPWFLAAWVLLYLDLRAREEPRTSARSAQLIAEELDRDRPGLTGLLGVGGGAAAVEVGGEGHQPGRGQLVAGTADVRQQPVPVVGHQHPGHRRARLGASRVGRFGQVEAFVIGHRRSFVGEPAWQATVWL
jgi:hypothetical protein